MTARPQPPIPLLQYIIAFLHLSAGLSLPDADSELPQPQDTFTLLLTASVRHGPMSCTTGPKDLPVPPGELTASGSRQIGTIPRLKSAATRTPRDEPAIRSGVDKRQGVV